MLAICDGENGCGRQWDLKRVTVDRLGEVEKTYFTCPGCGKEYLCYYTDPSIRRKQSKIRTLTNTKRINKMKKEIGKDMDRLKNKMMGTQ